MGCLSGALAQHIVSALLTFQLQPVTWCVWGGQGMHISYNLKITFHGLLNFQSYIQIFASCQSQKLSSSPRSCHSAA